MMELLDEHSRTRLSRGTCMFSLHTGFVPRMRICVLACLVVCRTTARDGNLTFLWTNRLFTVWRTHRDISDTEYLLRHVFWSSFSICGSPDWSINTHRNVQRPWWKRKFPSYWTHKILRCCLIDNNPSPGHTEGGDVLIFGSRFLLYKENYTCDVCCCDTSSIWYTWRIRS
jgi:hypothetical protein